jgi:hypothetical protein
LRRLGRVGEAGGCAEAVAGRSSRLDVADITIKVNNISIKSYVLPWTCRAATSPPPTSTRHVACTYTSAACAPAGRPGSALASLRAFTTLVACCKRSLIQLHVDNRHATRSYATWRRLKLLLRVQSFPHTSPAVSNDGSESITEAAAAAAAAEAAEAAEAKCNSCLPKISCRLYQHHRLMIPP